MRPRALGACPAHWRCPSRARRAYPGALRSTRVYFHTRLSCLTRCGVRVRARRSSRVNSREQAILSGGESAIINKRSVDRGEYYPVGSGPDSAEPAAAPGEAAAAPGGRDSVTESGGGEIDADAQFSVALREELLFYMLLGLRAATNRSNVRPALPLPLPPGVVRAPLRTEHGKHGHEPIAIGQLRMLARVRYRPGWAIDSIPIY